MKYLLRIQFGRCCIAHITGSVDDLAAVLWLDLMAGTVGFHPHLHDAWHRQDDTEPDLENEPPAFWTLTHITS